MVTSAAVTYALATDCGSCTVRVGEPCSMRSSNMTTHSSRLIRGEALRRRDVAIAAALLTDRDRIIAEPCPTCLARPQEACTLHPGRFHQSRADRAVAGDSGRKAG